MFGRQWVTGGILVGFNFTKAMAVKLVVEFVYKPDAALESMERFHSFLNNLVQLEDQVVHVFTEGRSQVGVRVIPRGPADRITLRISFVPESNISSNETTLKC